MNIHRVWNSTEGFIFDDEKGKTLYGNGTKNKLLYTFYGGTTIKTIVDDCSFAGPDFILEITELNNTISLSIFRQTHPSKKIFNFVKLNHN